MDITIGKNLDVQGKLEEMEIEQYQVAGEEFEQTIIPEAPRPLEAQRVAPKPEGKSSKPHLKLTDISSGFQFVIILMDTEFQEITLGRPDRESGFVPVVDLTFVEGHKKGVSRFHAVIVRYGDGLGLTDNSSSNGTFVNGERLMISQTRKLRDGDLIKLGGVKLKLTYT